MFRSTWFENNLCAVDNWGVRKEVLNSIVVSLNCLCRRAPSTSEASCDHIGAKSRVILICADGSHDWLDMNLGLCGKEESCHGKCLN